MSFLWVALLVLSGCSDPPEEPAKQKMQTTNPAAERPAWMAPPGSERWVEGDVAKEKVIQAEESRPLKVGVIGPEAGEEARYGLSIRDGVAQAAAAFNAQGGIKGQPMEWIYVDSRDDAAMTEKAVRDLIQQRVIGIIAAPTGWSTFVPTRFANDSQTLLMIVGTKRSMRSGPYVFRFSLPDEQAVEILLGHLVQSLHYTRFALVTASAHDESLMISAQFKQSVLSQGGQVIVEADTYDTYSGQPAIGDVVQRLVQAEAVEAILYSGGAEEGAQLAKALRGAGIRAPLVGGEDLFEADFLQKGGQDVLGTLLFSSYVPERGPPYFRDRFTALAYDAFMSMAWAVEQAGSTNPAKVRAALLTMTDREGVTGKSGFTADGLPVKQPFFYRVEQEQDKLAFRPVTWDRPSRGQKP